MPNDPDRTLADLAQHQHGVFTIDDARNSGLSDDQVERRVARAWVLLYDRVYRVAGAPPTWHGELRAATFAAGPTSAISHRSAAALYGLPGGRRDLTELTCIRWKRTVRPGLVVHESRRLASSDVRQLDGIPVTRPERTLLDIAACVPNANYLELVIQTARRKRLLTYESTREVFGRHARRGLRGVSALREALDRWHPDSRPTESEMETLLLQTLRENGLPEPIVQYEVRDATGSLIARADAAYPFARIALEYDSKQEHSDEFQITRDARRRNALQASGYVVLSARHADLLVGGTVLCDQIAAIIRRSNAEPRPAELA